MLELAHVKERLRPQLHRLAQAGVTPAVQYSSLYLTFPCNGFPPPLCGGFLLIIPSFSLLMVDPFPRPALFPLLIPPNRFLRAFLLPSSSFFPSSLCNPPCLPSFKWIHSASLLFNADFTFFFFFINWNHLLSFVQIFFFFFPLSELNPPVSLYKGDNPPPPPTASSNSLLILFPRSSFHLLAVSLLAPPPRPPGESGLTQLYFPLYLR